MLHTIRSAATAAIRATKKLLTQIGWRSLRVMICRGCDIRATVNS